MKAKAFLLRAACVAGGLLAALALAELGLRVRGGRPLEPPWYPGDHVPATSMTVHGVVDSTIGWKLAPGAIDDETSDFHVGYSIGADGFRTTTSDAGPDAPLVVFVGDSFTFGSGIADGETFVERVAAALGVRPLNLGMAGFGVDQMWRTLVRYGLEREPQLVVATFVDDDLTRSCTAFRYRNGWVAKPTYTLAGGELVAMDEAHRPAAPVRWFLQHSRLAGVLRKLSWHTPTGGARWRLNRALFAAMRDACRDADVPLVCVRIPDRDRWAPSGFFEREFRGLEIPLFDLGGVHVADARALFFAKDPHLDAAGHAVLASGLAEFLRARHLLSQ